MNDSIRTASTEELREHVKRVGILVLATLMGFQALLAMSVVYLLFLLLSQPRSPFSFRLRDKYN
jgi:hypothetical protein